jgi:hypothetical protein
VLVGLVGIGFGLVGFAVVAGLVVGVGLVGLVVGVDRTPVGVGLAAVAPAGFAGVVTAGLVAGFVVTGLVVGGVVVTGVAVTGVAVTGFVVAGVGDGAVVAMPLPGAAGPAAGDELGVPDAPVGELLPGDDATGEGAGPLVRGADAAAAELVTVGRDASTPVSVGTAGPLTAVLLPVPVGSPPLDRPATTKITPTSAAISTTMKMTRRSQYTPGGRGPTGCITPRR